MPSTSLVHNKLQMCSKLRKAMEKTPIGKVERIRRYPVKSMAGTDINSTYVHETGINGDRVYALYDYNSHRASLPYLTIRELTEMMLLQPKIVNESATDEPYTDGYKPEVEVRIGDKNISLHDPQLVTYLHEKLDKRNHKLTIDFRRSGIFDTKPISIISLSSVKQLAKEMDKPSLDPLRFRGNFYIQWDNDKPFYEEKLLGESLQIGNEVVLHIVKSNIRCTNINVDPKTAEKDSSVLKTVSQQHDTKFGIYGEVRTCGKVSVGDRISILDES